MRRRQLSEPLPAVERLALVASAAAIGEPPTQPGRIQRRRSRLRAGSPAVEHCHRPLRSPAHLGIAL